MPSYALKGYLGFFKQQKKDLIFSTVNCLSKGSQVRILAQTNIFFFIFMIFYYKTLLLGVKIAVLMLILSYIIIVPICQFLDLTYLFM